MRQTEALLGLDDTAGQLQQRPSPEGESILLSEWWSAEKNPQNRFNPRDRSIYNRAVARWLFYDTAFKDRESNDTNAQIVFDLVPDYRVINARPGGCDCMCRRSRPM